MAADEEAASGAVVGQRGRHRRFVAGVAAAEALRFGLKAAYARPGSASANGPNRFGASGELLGRRQLHVHYNTRAAEESGSA